MNKDKPLNVFEFIGNQQRRVNYLEKKKAPKILLAIEENQLDGMSEVYHLLNLWIKYLKQQEDKPSLEVMALLKEVVND